AGVMDALKVQRADLVTHDIGNMVGYALAAQYPVRVTRWVVIDAPLPGIGDWDNITRSPMLWHFNFRDPDEERLVQGRERIYLDRFWNELSADPKGIDEDTRQHYAALYAQPHAMHDAFEQFGAFSQDAADNKALLAKGGKIAMPVFAIGAEKFFGKGMGDEMRFAASNVTGGIVPNSGHWIMEENPQATSKLVTDFLAREARSHGKCHAHHSAAFASVHARKRDSEGAPRRGWVEHSRPGKGRSGLRDRFTMEE